jgi:anti-sigma-K factor RskA
MNIARNERLLDKLAAEYVLGTLKGGARRRYEAWLATDAQVQRATAQWQDRLHPMAQLAPAVAPPDYLWHALASQLGLPAQAAVAAPANRRSFWRGLHDDLSFWRGLGMVSTALATILVAVLATRPPGPPAPSTQTAQNLPAAPAAASASASASYVALLADDKAQPVAVITGDQQNHRLTVKLVLPQTVAADKSLQLWAVPKAGAPRSLGLVAGEGSQTLALPADATPQSVALLAISLEPKGGSPNPNAPTGPIVYKGAWLQL